MSVGRTPKLAPAELPNGGQGGFLKMANGGNIESLDRKHNTERDALDAKHAAEKAAMEHKHSEERKKFRSSNTIATPSQVTSRVRRPNMAKYPKGK